MRIIKEEIGWTISKEYYRVNSSIIAKILFFTDKILSIPFFYLKKKKFPDDPKKILIIRGDHIGDMIITSSFIETLKKRFPKSTLTILCPSEVKSIAKHIPYIDKVIPLNAPWFSRENSLSYPELVRFAYFNRKKYDLIFEMHSDPRNIILGRIIGKYVCGYSLRGFSSLLNKRFLWESKTKHMNERNLDMLRQLKIDKIENNQKIELNKKSLIKIQELLSHNKIRQFILIQMSAGTKAKEWPLEYWKEFITKKYKKHTIITADQDHKKIESLKKKIGEEKFFHFTLTLPEYACLVSLATKIYTVDTFTLHLAEALNKRVIALLSGTNLSEEWGPIKGKFIQSKTCKKYPCGLSECIYGNPSRCMKELKFDKIANL